MLIDFDAEEMARRAAEVRDFSASVLRPRVGYSTAQEAVDAAGHTPEGYGRWVINDGLAYWGRPDLSFSAWRVVFYPNKEPTP